MMLVTDTQNRLLNSYSEAITSKSIMLVYVTTSGTILIPSILFNSATPSSG